MFEKEEIARVADLGLAIVAPEQIELGTADSDSAAFATELRQLLSAQRHQRQTVFLLRLSVLVSVPL